MINNVSLKTGIILSLFEMSGTLFHSNDASTLWKLILAETALCILSENSSVYCISSLIIV